MPLFTISGLDSSASAELAVTSHALATYSQTDRALGLPLGQMLETLDDIAGPGTFSGNQVTSGLPSGWREVSASELGLSPSVVDVDGYITLQSPLLGNVSRGPQLKVLAEQDALGNISRVSVAYAGTNAPVDIVDYSFLNSGKEIAKTMAPVLSGVASFMDQHGLEGDDAIITGYSLGGALANIQARFSDQLAGGFFADSHYLGHASPLIFEADNVLNIGFENDVIHRFVGDHEDLKSALKGFDGFLENSDENYSSSVDNLVLFDAVYSKSPWLLASDSGLNPFAWGAHLGGITSDAVARIVSSSFYELMSQDSVVVVSSLGAGGRAIHWVGDIDSPTSNHAGEPAFIVGSVFDDLLRDGASDDYIEGFAGDDQIRVSTGTNQVEGGQGSDTLLFEGEADDYEIYRLDDGRIGVSGHDSLTLASGIERIEFEYDGGFSGAGPGLRYVIEDDRLEDEFRFDWFDRDIAFVDAPQEGQGAEWSREEVALADAGDSVFSAAARDDALHLGDLFDDEASFSAESSRDSGDGIFGWHGGAMALAGLEAAASFVGSALSGHVELPEAWQAI